MPVHDSKKPVTENSQRDLSEYADHRAKLEVAMGAEMVKDLREILRMNRAGMQRVEDELMGDSAKGDDDMGDINIDSPTSMHYHYPPGKDDGSLLKTIAVGGGLLAGIVAGAMLFKSSGTPPPVGPADSNYRVLFFDKDGKPISVPHISERPK